MNTDLILRGLVSRYKEILGENYIGLYVHGSMCMSGFNPKKSDIDYIIVCESVPTDIQKRAVMDATMAYAHLAPAKGLEMHLVLKNDCANFAYPPHFELHFSPAHVMNYLKDPAGYVGWMKGGDPDLCAHLMVTYHRGIAFDGPAVREIFGPVPREAYLESILSDAEWSDDDCMYAVLNRCRTMGYIATGRVMSKHEGALWAMENAAPEYREMIRDVLDCYETDRVMQPTDTARRFFEEALAAQKSEMGL